VPDRRRGLRLRHAEQGGELPERALSDFALELAAMSGLKIDHVRRQLRKAGAISEGETNEKVLVFNHKDYIFHLLKARDQWKDLVPHERVMLENVFAGGTDVTLSSLKNRFYTAVPVVRGDIMAALRRKGMYSVDPSAAGAYSVGAAVAKPRAAGAAIPAKAAAGASKRARPELPPASVNPRPAAPILRRVTSRRRRRSRATRRLRHRPPPRPAASARDPTSSRAGFTAIVAPWPRGPLRAASAAHGCAPSAWSSAAPA